MNKIINMKISNGLMIKKLFFTSISLLVISCFFPQVVFGIGQTTDPIIINDALRGETFQKEMIIMNTDKESTLVQIKAEGDIEGWTKFYKSNDLKNPIDSILMKAGARANLFAEISVPDDIKNGKYSGSLSAVRTPKSEVASSGSSSAVTQKIDRQVNITVSDKENIEIKVSVIPDKYDLDEEEPLNVRLIYDNQGNVSVKPEVGVKIKKDDKELFNISYPFAEGVEAIKPKAVFEVPSIQIPTSMLEKGRYAFEFDFKVDGKSVSSDRFVVAIGDVPPASPVNKVAVTTDNNYKNWIISALVGAVALMFTIYSFSKSKKKEKYIKKSK